MNKPSLNLGNWRSMVGAFAISLGAFGMIESPVDASPNQLQDSFKLAQVGIRSRTNAPTPLNLTPRTHIPLPTSRHNRHRQSSDYYENRGHRGFHRGHRQYRGSRRHDRYDHHHHDHHPHQRRNHSRRDSVIIINPSNSNSNHSNYDGYIRVIRK